MVKNINEQDFNLNKDELIVVDFYADWCGPCKMISPVLEELSEKIQGVEFKKVNVDQNPNLTREYKVMSIPTLVLIKDGVEVGRQIGFVTKNSIEKWIETNR